MRVGHLELPVANPLESMSFYVDMLGFELVANQGDQFIWVKAGAQELLLKPAEADSARGDPDTGPLPTRRNICLYTDDLDAELVRLRGAGIEPTLGDGCCWYFRDPDGHQFQLVDPSDHS